jgi:hypothetical protein
MRPKLGNARNRAFSTALALMRSMAGPHKAGFLNSLLVGPRGESLVRAIEEWYKEYGSAL